VTFSPKAYWSKRGQVYEQQAIDGGWWDGEQEGIPDLLATLTFSSVLEVGCGFGRVGASIKAHWPEVEYTGIDISPDLVNAAQKRLPDSEIIEADMVIWNPDRRWDLVLAISSLSHIPPEDIFGVVRKLLAWARRDIVVVDWNQIGGKTAYQHGHDIAALLGPRTKRVSVRGPGQTPEDGRMAMWHLPR
jgi:SAM-dependent methyltransferase